MRGVFVSLLRVDGYDGWWGCLLFFLRLKCELTEQWRMNEWMKDRKSERNVYGSLVYRSLFSTNIHRYEWWWFTTTTHRKNMKTRMSQAKVSSLVAPLVRLLSRTKIAAARRLFSFIHSFVCRWIKAHTYINIFLVIMIYRLDCSNNWRPQFITKAVVSRPGQDYFLYFLGGRNHLSNNNNNNNNSEWKSQRARMGKTQTQTQTHYLARLLLYLCHSKTIM